MQVTPHLKTNERLLNLEKDALNLKVKLQSTASKALIERAKGKAHRAQACTIIVLTSKNDDDGDDDDDVTLSMTMDKDGIITTLDDNDGMKLISARNHCQIYSF